MIANARQELINKDVDELKQKVSILEKSAVLFRGGYKTLLGAGAVITFVLTTLYHFTVVEKFFHKG